MIPDLVPCDDQLRTAFLTLEDSLNIQDTFGQSFFELLDSANAKLGTCSDVTLDSLGGAVNDRVGRMFLSAGEYEEARTYFLISLAARKRLLPNEQRNVIRMYHNIGLTYLRDFQPREAILYLDSADIWTPEVSPRPFIDTKLRKGICYQDLGEYSNSAFELQIAYDTAQVHGFPNQTELVYSLASVHRQLRNFAFAITLGNEEVKRLQLLDVDFDLDLANLHLVLANTWQDSLATATDQTFVKKEIVRNYQLALKIYQAYEYPANISVAVGNLGEFFRKEKRYEEAIELIKRAIVQVKALEVAPQWLVQLYLNLGETFYNQGKFEEALEYYDSSLQAMVPSYLIQDKLPALSYPVPDRSDEIILLGDIAQTQLAKFQEDTTLISALQGAQITFDSLFKLVNRVRGDFVSDQAKLNLAAEIQPALGKAFATSLQLAEVNNVQKQVYFEKAFRIAEQSKAFLLLELTRLNTLTQNLPEGLRKREGQLQAEQARLDAARFAEVDEKEKARLNQAYQDNFEEIRRFQQQLKSEFPDVYQSKYEGIEIGIDDIQQRILAADQVLIEFFIEEQASYAFLISSDDYEVKRIPVTKEFLENEVRAFRQLLETSALTPEQEIQFVDLAQSLYQQLLAPLESSFQERLILVPDGILNNLPFEALLVNDTPGDLKLQAKNENFLLFHQAVSYNFSVSLLDLMQSRERPKLPKKGPTVFACTFNLQLSRQKKTEEFSGALKNNIQYLTNLGINQQAEVSGIQEKFPKAPLYQDTLANENQFQQTCQRAAVLHLVTHGILNEQDPNFSFLSFTQQDPQLNFDELLFVKELYAARGWNLDMMFLSACQTASGAYFAGEGNISMSSALAQAGVRSMVTTFWNVPTYTKAKIAPLFYDKYLHEKQDKDMALAFAKRSVAREAMPYDWAGLILMGATQ